MSRLATLFGLVLVGGMLGGCAQVPVDHREPYKIIELDLPPEQVYAGMNKHPLCESFVYSTGSFDTSGRSFEIRYTFSPPTSLSEIQTDLILGEVTEGGGTRLVMRSTLGKAFSNQTLNQLRTGSCDG